MEHHVFSVWDFMSEVKFLQGSLAPTYVPWTPVGDPLVRRFINDIVLEEESDRGVPETGQTPEYLSHFELYTYAMTEVGASPAVIKAFVAEAQKNGIEGAFSLNIAPRAAADFTRKTFDFISSGKPHVVSAAFALGREHIIPGMFRSLLEGMRIQDKDAPAFHYYLKRHIHLDEDHHGPLSIRMLEYFIQNNAKKRDEAFEAAIAAIDARINFWDGVQECLPSYQALAG